MAERLFPPTAVETAGLAERLLQVIDSGRRTATYNLALLLALLDICERRPTKLAPTPRVGVRCWLSGMTSGPWPSATWAPRAWPKRGSGPSRANWSSPQKAPSCKQKGPSSDELAPLHLTTQ